MLEWYELWLHINDSTPKLKDIINEYNNSYDYILMIAHQNSFVAITSYQNVMITY